LDSTIQLQVFGQYPQGIFAHFTASETLRQPVSEVQPKLKRSRRQFDTEIVVTQE